MQQFFKDKSGNIVLGQWPNPPLWLWLATVVIRWLPLPDNVLQLNDTISFGALFVWAWLELFEGVNLFRRILGAVVLVAITVTASL